MDRNFLVSVVIPVYKVEKYLAETVDSVIAQTIGFEDNIQIIFVNDGSPDNSEKICLEYRERYPDNILYINKPNGGVSSARNEGIPYIRGKYVNFLDSDDIWDKDAFRLMTGLLESTGETADVVSARKKFFDARDGWHHLDYRFEQTKIADLTQEYEFVQLDVTGALIRSSAIGQLRFNEKLKYGEDAAFVGAILLEKCKLGVCREAIHYYRKRSDDSSALQNELRSRSYFFDSPRYFHKYLFTLSKRKYGFIERFIQYTVMYDIGWRIRKDLTGALSPKDYKRYCDLITALLRKIDDCVIMKQRHIWKKQKLYCLLQKRGMKKTAALYRRVSKTKIMFR